MQGTTPPLAGGEVGTDLAGLETESVHRELIIADLEATLLSFLVMDGPLCGQEVIQRFDSVFDMDMSPGTVYPLLHDFHDDGILNCREVVQTKQYAVADQQAVGERLQQSAYELLLFHAFMSNATQQVEWANAGVPTEKVSRELAWRRPDGDHVHD